MRRQAVNRRAPAAVFTLGVAVAVAGMLSAIAPAAPRDPFTLGRDAGRWVDQTLNRMSVDEKVGQLVMPSFETGYLPTDSDAFDQLARLVREQHVGGFLIFGATELAPQVMLNPSFGSVILGSPLAAASALNRLQAMSTVPLMNAADFEAGVGFRLNGATLFPREMAMGAAGDERLVHEEGRVTASEARAIGVHVIFGPVADVNNNPRNPVINTRSYGEEPARVSALVGAFVDGAREGGAIATLKHFPGHGDTDVDSHIGLPLITSSRERLDAVEFPPFRAGIAHGAAGVMGAHIVVPALDGEAGKPATFSQKILGDVLRKEMGFEGLVFTDSLKMEGVTRLAPNGDAAVRAILGGADMIEDPPDAFAALAALKAAVGDGRISTARLDDSVRRILRAKASLGLDREKLVDLNALASKVGGRANGAPADEASMKAVTLVKDAASSVPLTVTRDQPVLYLSVLDYPNGWRIAAPGRTLIPELRKRWPQVTPVEISDHTSATDLDMVRQMQSRYAAVVAGVYVRANSGSGRMDLSPEVTKFLKDAARAAERAHQPFVTVFFGNPYTASFLPELPTMMLTFDLYDRAERSAVRAMAGETAIGGHLPIALPGMFAVGHGIARPQATGEGRR